MRTYEQIVRQMYGEGRSSFWSGFAGALNLFGTGKKNRLPRRGTRSVADALTEDWSHVSRDLERAFRRAGCR